jgi:hypothetical protein
MSRTTIRRFALAVALLAISLKAVGSAYAANYDWQANPGYSGTFNAATNWNAGAGVGASGAPGVNDDVTFKNAQGSPYTVGFSGNIATQYFEVNTDKVNYNLNGFQWTSQVPDSAAFDIGGSAGTAWRIGAVAGNNTTVVFSSSAVGGVISTPNSPNGTYRSLVIGNTTGATSATLDNSLGNGATWSAQGSLILLGNTQFNIDAGSTYTNNYSVFFNLGGYSAAVETPSINIRNGGKFLLPTATYAFSLGAGSDVPHINVETAGLLDMPLTNPSIGYLNPGYVDVKTGGTWNAQDAQIGLYHFYVNNTYQSTVTVDGATSTANLRNITLGNATELGANDNGEVVLQNSGTMTVKNTMLLNIRQASAAARAKNTLTLNTGTLKMGDATNAGLIDSHGIIRGVGTIERNTGNTSNFQVTNGSEGELRPGDITATPAIGTLALDHGNLTQTSAGTAFFNFDSALSGSADLIDITAGTANIDGTVVFSSFSPTGSIGTWDFVKASSITYTATDNMAAVIASLNLQQNWGYDFGVVSEGGFQYLRLSVEVIPVPEPSTFMLLGACCLGLVCKKRRGRK